ncbi:hypothetical protein AAV94_13755 [Lampropedia cohaerens]|uniref:HTH lysR-type domain-containing protein n=1 Tax=Lampropedia cohaerens TaxID=1610491 RepID=A0A0U1PW93_9BURK|nr:LysR family transcriptional regulator [Lampropedia cohaerens]KKW66812.1 hypothetical protein AAV94_13755 [Lampropedia cohaerens]
MSDRVEQFRIFIHVAETGSFIGAARALKLPPATVSTSIRKLEKQLGTQLLRRTTRKVSLTEDGRKTLPMARKIVGDLDEFYNLFKHSSNAVAGRLNVDVHSRIAARIIVPALPSLLEMHPQLELSLGSSDKELNLSEADIDCAIRVGAYQQDHLVVRPLGQLAMVSCASEDYLRRCGLPQTPQELDRHCAIGYLPAQPQQHPAVWEYQDEDGQSHSVQMQHRVMVTSAENYLACGVAGLGLIQVPRFDVQELLQTGKLIEVLPHWPAPPKQVCALYLHRKQRSKRLLAFLDWIHALLRKSPGVLA